MSKFLDAPPEGQVTMALIVLALALLLGSGLMRNSGGITRKGADGYWALSWPRARWVQLAAAICFALVFSVAAAFTEDCPKWTPEQNAWNQQLGFLIAGASWIGVVALFAPWHGYDYKFNETEFVATPLLGGVRVFPWSALQDMGEDSKGAFLSFQKDRKFYVPTGNTGVPQLLAQIDCRMLSAKRPIAPIFDEKDDYLAGKSVRVMIFRPGYNGLPDFVSATVGHFDAVSPDGMAVALDTGQRLEVAANIRGLALSNDDVDEVDEDGEVTTECVLVVWEGDGRWVEPVRPVKAKSKQLEPA